MDTEKISFVIKHRGDSIKFHLRTISPAEDGEYYNRRSSIADKKGKAKEDADYRLYVDALADWSCEMPTREGEDGKPVALGTGTPKEAVLEYFRQPTVSKQWIAMQSVASYRDDLYPTVTFQRLSE